MYNSIQELNNIPKVEQELPTEKQEVYNVEQELSKEKQEGTMVQIMQELSMLRMRVSVLESELASVKLQSVTPERQKKSILDWTPTLRKTKGKAMFWYAVRRVGRKLFCVYIGKDLSKAETKIREYCQKHGISLKEQE
jgi:hypothetical protein